MPKPVTIEDYRDAARRRLPRFLFDYIDGGSYQERTLAANRDDLARLMLRQRVLRDVSSIDLGIDLFGERHALPVLLGPIGIAGMFARRGETQAARAAHARGVQFCLSTVSVCSLEEVRAAVTRPFWFQLYVMKDRGFLRDLLARVSAAGCGTLFFTVDMPVPGARYRDYRSGLAGATGPSVALRRFGQACRHPHWAWSVGMRGRPHNLGNVASVLGRQSGLEDFMSWMGRNFDPSVTWSDIEAVRAAWDGALVLKGILDPEDAVRAADLGVDGIVVSNHGGRQLDGAPSTASMLPRIADAVGDRLTLLADGGVRSGLDIFRMIALGADAVILGRAWAYGLAAAGEAGVADILDIIRAELRTAMALTGTDRIAAIGRDAVIPEAG